MADEDVTKVLARMDVYELSKTQKLEVDRMLAAEAKILEDMKNWEIELSALVANAGREFLSCSLKSDNITNARVLESKISDGLWSMVGRENESRAMRIFNREKDDMVNPQSITDMGASCSKKTS